MMTATRRRIGAPAWLALGLVIGLPALAQAQLFPNRNINRQKPSCASEPPFNAHVRRDYFGYYPTCWSKFPEGWACPCPNPELPNLAKAFADRPRDPFPALPPVEPPPDSPDGPMNRDPLPTDPNNTPPLPAGRAPFDLDRPDGPAPTTPDPSLPPRGPAGTRPNLRPGENPGNPPVNRGPSTTTGLLEMPSMSPPSAAMAAPIADPGALTLAPDATLTSNTNSSSRDLGPLPSAPLPATTTPVDINAPLVTAPAPAPAQAPRRQSLLGGLFGNRKRR